MLNSIMNHVKAERPRYYLVIDDRAKTKINTENHEILRNINDVIVERLPLTELLQNLRKMRRVCFSCQAKE